MIGHHIVDRKTSGTKINKRIIQTGKPNHQSFPYINKEPVYVDLCILNPIALTKSSRRLEFVKYVESQGAIFVAIHLRAFCCFRGLEDGCW